MKSRHTIRVNQLHYCIFYMRCDFDAIGIKHVQGDAIKK